MRALCAQCPSISKQCKNLAVNLKKYVCPYFQRTKTNFIIKPILNISLAGLHDYWLEMDMVWNEYPKLRKPSIWKSLFQSKLCDFLGNLEMRNLGTITSSARNLTLVSNLKWKLNNDRHSPDCQLHHKCLVDKRPIPWEW